LGEVDGFHFGLVGFVVFDDFLFVFLFVSLFVSLLVYGRVAGRRI